MIIHKKFIEHLLGLLILQSIFVALSHYVIIPGQGYYEYIPAQSNIDILKIPIVIAFILFLSIYFSLKRAVKTDLIDFFIYSYLIMLILPYLSFYLLADFQNLFKVMYGFFLMIIFANVIIFLDYKSPSSKSLGIIFNVIAFIMIAYFFVFAIYVFIKNPSLNILEYYKNRRLYVSSGFPLLGYITPWLTNVLVPLLIAVGLYKKNNLYIVLAISVAFSIAMFAGFRSALGILIMVGFFYTFIKFNFSIFLAWFSFTLLAAVSVLIDVFTDLYDVSIFASLFRRAFFAQAGIHEIYLNFFNAANFTYGSNTFFDLTKSYMDVDPQRTISPIIAGSRSGLNVGWLGDGYGNFGMSGIFIYSFIIGILIGLSNLFFNNTFKVNSYKFSFITIGLALTLTNSALTVTFLTHGLGFFVFCLFALQGNKI